MHPLKSTLHTFPSSGSYTVVICTLFPVHVQRNPVYYTLHLSLTSKQKHDIPVTHPTPYLLHVGVVQLQPEISNDGTVGLEGLVWHNYSAVQVSLDLFQRRHLLLQPAHLILQVLLLWLPLQTNIQLAVCVRKKKEFSNVRYASMCWGFHSVVFVVVACVFFASTIFCLLSAHTLSRPFFNNDRKS